ncbi:F-box protein [Quillaja saponaria]|uniref:F-box protein n=1 Tax=Quillaja saponaria TaxID=32244 RepID=A0AAD7L270_QUISA|nr:F-box protein [Quillaja saponaria]
MYDPDQESQDLSQSHHRFLFIFMESPPHHHPADLEIITKKAKKGDDDEASNAETPIISFLEILPVELKLEILSRIPLKAQGRMKCLSKPWQKFIDEFQYPNCISIMKPLYCWGFLLCLENDSKSNSGSTFVMHRQIHLEHELQTHVGFDDLVESFSDSLGFNPNTRELLDSSSGLLLFCHRNKKAKQVRFSVWLYYHRRGINVSVPFSKWYFYYVLNPFTKQCVRIAKPCPKTARCMYAALAYDAEESSFFKIVRFQGFRGLQVYSSQTGQWTNLKYHLEDEVTQSVWVRKCEYLKGAIYRVSHSGHLLIFKINEEVSLEDQARAIELPEIAWENPNSGCIGIRDDAIQYAFWNGTSLLIWELKHQLEWCLVYKSKDALQSTREVIDGSHALAIHPYNNWVLFKKDDHVFCFYCNLDSIVHHQLKRGGSDIRNWNFALGFPITQCIFPFVVKLKNDQTGIFS